MSIRSISGFDSQRTSSRSLERTPAAVLADDEAEIPLLNLQEELNNSLEEMADLISNFGFTRNNRSGRKNSELENEFSSAILEEQADEKLDMLIHQVVKIADLKNLINLARQLFPNESDLLLALREMLLSRQLSELKKKKIREAITDLEKFGDSRKIRSGINIGRLAKRFSHGAKGKALSAKDLRECYLNFIEMEMSPGFIYQEWIDVYGCEHRTRLLSFTLAALIADMKANEPGVHSSEFGPLSSKLSDARVLNTLDNQLNQYFSQFAFRAQLRHEEYLLEEADIIGLYLIGLIDFDEFKRKLKEFNEKFMLKLLLKHRTTVIQTLKNIYNLTPNFLFINEEFRELITNFLSSLLNDMYKKEKNTGIWKEHYK